MTSPFPKWKESLDPDEPLGKIYNYWLVFADGDSLTAAQVDVVDPKSTTIDPDPIVIVTNVASGPGTGPREGQTGISFRAQGTGVIGRAYLRLRYATALGNGDDETWYMNVKQR